MKHLLSVLLVMVMGIAVWSCSNDSITDPVTIVEIGSNSLLVNADVEGSEDIGSGTFSTSYVVTIEDSLNQPVNDASVVMNHSQLGTITMPWDSVTPGRYAAGTNGYAEGQYFLHVRRGTDSLVNGQVYAPDIHQILYPTTADTLAQDQPFTVRWARTTAAQQVEVETLDFGPSLSSGIGADSGAFVIPASFNNRDDQRIRVWRSNSVSLVTGLAGSSMKAEIRNAVEPIVVQ